MATIRKNKSGNYEARVYTGLDTNKEKCFEYLTRPSLHEIKAAVREIEEEVDNKTYSNMKHMKFAAFADKWYDIKKTEVEDTTCVSYEAYIKEFKEEFSRYKLGQITEMHIKEYISKGTVKSSKNTMRKKYFVLRELLYDSLKLKSPMRDLEPPNKIAYIPVVPTKEEFTLINNAVKGMPDEIIILLAAWCGFRLGEILALKWDDINFDRKTIRINESLGKTKKETDEEVKYIYKEKNTKSIKGNRTVVVSDKIIELLSERKKEHCLNGELSSKIFSWRVDKYSARFSNVINIHNELIDIKNGILPPKKPNHTKQSIKALIHVQDQKLLDCRFHDLRHYHASQLYENDILDQYAAERLGHDVETLKTIYQHIKAEKKKDLDNKVLQIFTS